MSRNIAVAALALVASFASSPTRADQTKYIEPHWLLDYPDGDYVSDFRPTINQYGSRIVFERSFYVAKKGYADGPYLYIADLHTKKFERLINKKNSFGIEYTARPDWCWAPGPVDQERPIAFSVGNGVKIGPQDGTYIVNPNDTSQIRFLAGSQKTIYPTWYPTCSALAVFAYDTLSHTFTSGLHQTTKVGPQTQEVDAKTGALEKLLSGKKMWAGFASVNRANPQLIAFAAQQFVPQGYLQDFNYVYIADTSVDPPRITPLDPHAPINSYNGNYQGRAPTWSPDGKWIAFESDRACPGKDPTERNYALFLEDSKGSAPARQLTECGYDGQHAKWFKEPVNGRVLLIATLRHNPNAKDGPARGVRGIASLDVTDIVGAPTK